MSDGALKERILAHVTDKLLSTGEREHLDINIVNKTLALIQHIFHKDPEKKDTKCILCQD